MLPRWALNAIERVVVTLNRPSVRLGHIGRPMMVATRQPAILPSQRRQKGLTRMKSVTLLVTAIPPSQHEQPGRAL